MHRVRLYWSLWLFIREKLVMKVDCRIHCEDYRDLQCMFLNHRTQFEIALLIGCCIRCFLWLLLISWWRCFCENIFVWFAGCCSINTVFLFWFNVQFNGLINLCTRLCIARHNSHLIVIVNWKWYRNTVTLLCYLCSLLCMFVRRGYMIY